LVLSQPTIIRRKYRPLRLDKNALKRRFKEVQRLDQKPLLEMAENADSARAFVERLLATGKFRLTSLKHLKSENLYLAARGLALPACFSTALIRSSSPNSIARSYRISHTFFAAFHFRPRV
jgi:hypothetical protein